MTFPTLSVIASELGAAAELVDEAEAIRLADAIQRADHVFVGGAGRSGFVARAFANRLLHLGIRVAFVGEPTTPPIAAGDLLIAISGSGRTASLRAAAEKAKSLGAAVATITIDPAGPIGSFADARVVLPGTSRLADAGTNVIASVQPVGSLFEQLAWLVCDALIVTLRDGSGQTNDDLLARHANLE